MKLMAACGPVSTLQGVSTSCQLVCRLQEQNTAFLVWRTLFVLLRQSANDQKAQFNKVWSRTMSTLAGDLR